MFEFLGEEYTVDIGVDNTPISDRYNIEETPCTESSIEIATLKCVLETEQGFNDIMVESSLDYVNEGSIIDGLKSFFKKIRDLIISAWKKIKGIISKAIETVKSKFKKGDTKVTGNKKSNNSDKVLDFNYREYNFDFLYNTEYIKKMIHDSGDFNVVCRVLNKLTNGDEIRDSDVRDFENIYEYDDIYKNTVVKTLSSYAKTDLSKYDETEMLDRMFYDKADNSIKTVNIYGKEAYDIAKRYETALRGDVATVATLKYIDKGVDVASNQFVSNIDKLTSILKSGDIDTQNTEHISKITSSAKKVGNTFAKLMSIIAKIVNKQIQTITTFEFLGSSFIITYNKAQGAY